MAITIRGGGGENVNPEVNRQAELLELLAEIIDKLVYPPSITAGENGEIEFENIRYEQNENDGITFTYVELLDDGSGNVTLQY